jgi:hypothetical protein
MTIARLRTRTLPIFSDPALFEPLSRRAHKNVPVLMVFPTTAAPGGRQVRSGADLESSHTANTPP